MSAFICILLVGSSFAFTLQRDSLYQFHGNNEWQVWKSTHGKAYVDPAEEHVRYTIWQDNMQRISEHNSMFSMNSVELGMNHFGDMTQAEFASVMNGRLPHKQTNGSLFMSLSNVQLPKSVDWRKEGYVTPVKNQGRCGSCWAFSTTGALEGQMFKKTGKLVSLSEQNLVDCAGAYGNNGCHGGLMDNAFQYIKDNGGIDTEASYPYKAKEGRCNYNPANKGGEDTGFVDIPQGDESALQNALATVGPVSVAIDASHFSLQFYRGGVYNEPRCSSTALDHGVLAVGYGTENGQDYWLVKNSWGAQWGMSGYVKMSRNRNNQCGIATAASYPLV